MSRTVVVLDINGILADVRRREAANVVGRMPDVILPNGQRAYMHPKMHDFMQALCNLPEVELILYTSRLERNAIALEDMIEKSVENTAKKMPIRYKLHGEQCLPPVSSERFHPRKSIGVVTALLRCEERDVLFVDDHPHRIVAGNARTLKVEPYDALRSVETSHHLGEAMREIMKFVFRQR